MRLLVIAAALAVAPAAAAQTAWLNERTRGAETAPVTIFEIADFQCPACRDFFIRTIPALDRDYVATGKVRIVFVNLPLVTIHPNAAAAHEFG